MQGPRNGGRLMKRWMDGWLDGWTGGQMVALGLGWECHAWLVGWLVGWWAQQERLSRKHGEREADLTPDKKEYGTGKEGSASEPRPARLIRPQRLIQEIVGSMLENGQEHPEGMMWIWNGRVAYGCEGWKAAGAGT